LEKGALFFAIRGAKDDGHKYVPGAAQKALRPPSSKSRLVNVESRK
jgi:hypothetical protein